MNRNQSQYGNWWGEGDLSGRPQFPRPRVMNPQVMPGAGPQVSPAAQNMGRPASPFQQGMYDVMNQGQNSGPQQSPNYLDPAMIFTGYTPSGMPDVPGLTPAPTPMSVMDTYNLAAPLPQPATVYNKKGRPAKNQPAPLPPAYVQDPNLPYQLHLPQTYKPDNYSQPTSSGGGGK